MTPMARTFLLFAFPILYGTALCAQYGQYEPLWFEARIQWADRFETLEPLNDTYAVVQHAGKYGVVDRSGAWVIPCRYRQHYSFNYMLRDGDCYAIYSDDGKIREICGYDQVCPWTKNFWQVTRNGRLGLVDSTGRLIVPMAFTSLYIRGNKILAADSSGLFGQLDPSGMWIFRPVYRRLEAAAHGFLLGQNNRDQWALLDSLGRPLTDFDFQNIIPLCDGTFWATRADHYRSAALPPASEAPLFRHYDKVGRLLPDPACETLAWVADSRVLAITRNGRREFWDGCGSPILPGLSWPAPKGNFDIFDWQRPTQKDQDYFPADLVKVEKNGLFGLYVPHQDRLIAAQYRQVYATAERIAACRPGGGTDWFDLGGAFIGTTADSIVAVIGNGLPYQFLIARHTGEYGVLDARGSLMIPARYRQLRPLESGCYVDSPGNHLFGPDGREIPVPDGSRVESVCGNYFVFSQGRNWGLADLSGRIRLKPEYGYLYPLNKFYFSFKQNDRYGVVDAAGRVVFPAEYPQNGIALREGYFFLKKDGQCAIAGLNGQLIAPFDYQEEVRFGDNMLLLKDRRAWRFDPASGTLTATGWEWRMHPGIVSYNGRWGMMDEKLRPLLPFGYDSIFLKEGFIAARKQGQDHLFAPKNGRLEPVAASRLIRNLYWATWLERGGKQGLQYTSGDSLPAIYDDIAIDYLGHGVLALLRDGHCTVPGPEGQAPLYEFPADSLRSFYLAGWLQYWHRGEAWVLNIQSGARRPLELLLPEGGEQNLYPGDGIMDLPQQTARIYRIKSQGRERYALLDDGLRDIIPDDLVFQPGHFILRPDGKVMVRVSQNGREGLWDVDKRELAFPIEYEDLAGIRLNSGQVSNFPSSGLPRPIMLPTDVIRLHKNGRYGLGRLSDGGLLLPCTYDFIDTATGPNGLLDIAKAGRTGSYRLSDGKILPRE